jgi:nucleoside-diphosphate-sugar epimerase|tara:strand:+ start:2392 stop:3126 length:735 start_codon:yes stop_codon:yes gene_type:complete
MNILLTGSEGFIGQHLNKFLNEQGHKVICLDKKTGNDLVSCDLKYSVDLVIHLAGLSGVRDSLGRPEEYWIQNVIAGQRLFDFFKDTRILYASSSTAHEPWKNPYAMSKYSLERIAPANSIGMRFTTVYGPNARESMLIPRILRNDVPYINTNHSRDFIHINDLVRAIDTLIKSDFKGITDIGSGVTNNLVELVDYFGIDCERAVGEENERLDNLADNTILNKIGWSPNIKLYDYIKEKRNASN